MTILSINSKTGYSVNFPIEQTCDKSCPFYQDKTCYGLKGRFNFGAVMRANSSRFELYRAKPNKYFTLLFKEIKRKKLTHLRINGVGDTPDRNWAELLHKFANETPEVHFFVSTRKLFWKTFDPVDNITVRFADGIDGDNTTSVTEDTAKATCPATVKDSGIHTCSECSWLCWNKGIKHVTFRKH